VICVKDQEGLYTADPATATEATFIRQITAAELLERRLPDLPFDAVVPDLLARARTVSHIQVINGMSSCGPQRVSQSARSSPPPNSCRICAVARRPGGRVLTEPPGCTRIEL
jgi:hypothetical protein